MAVFEGAKNARFLASARIVKTRKEPCFLGPIIHGMYLWNRWIFGLKIGGGVSLDGARRC